MNLVFFSRTNFFYRIAVWSENAFSESNWMDHFENRLIVIKEKRRECSNIVETIKIMSYKHEIEKHSQNEIEIAHPFNVCVLESIL